jgi:hypothetical protein
MNKVQAVSMVVKNLAVMPDREHYIAPLLSGFNIPVGCGSLL